MRKALTGLVRRFLQWLDLVVDKGCCDFFLVGVAVGKLQGFGTQGSGVAFKGLGFRGWFGVLFSS